YWGNYLNPSVIPSVSDTILNASGRYAMEVFFGSYISSPSGFGIFDAMLNIAILVFSGVLMIIAGQIYLKHNESRA
ncbi:MAG: hypothetical protein JW750_07485, partial [Anaerolineaceae bacterium]|nr:hypothetical protein [Anaerolineaceae bacterium]